eukprot:scaffold27703_cov75-Phaeocystis_antarctica.AAC.1
MTRVVGSLVRHGALAGTVTCSEPLNTAVWHGPVAEDPCTSKSVPPLSAAPHVRSLSRSTQLPPACGRESPTLESAPGQALGLRRVGTDYAPLRALHHGAVDDIPVGGSHATDRCPPKELDLTQSPFIRTSAGRPLQVLAVVKGTATRPAALRGDGPAVVLARHVSWEVCRCQPARCAPSRPAGLLHCASSKPRKLATVVVR